MENKIKEKQKELLCNTHADKHVETLIQRILELEKKLDLARYHVESYGLSEEVASDLFDAGEFKEWEKEIEEIFED